MVSKMHSRSSEEFHRGFHLRMASRMELWVKRAGLWYETGVAWWVETVRARGATLGVTNHPHTNAGFSAALVRPT